MNACEGLFPTTVAVAAAAIDQFAAAADPADFGDTTGVAPRRLRDFNAGRACARQALAALGFDRCRLPRRPDGAPQWPSGAVGSISHGAHLCVAVAGHARHWAALGVDVEDATPLDPPLWPHVAIPEELDAARRVLPSGVCAGKLIFSAKEAFYKCWRPVGGRFLDFLDVALSLTVEASGEGRYSARLVRAPDTFALMIQGRWRTMDSHLVCAAWAPAR